MKIDLPFGKGGIKTVDIPGERIIDVLSPPQISGVDNEDRVVKEALENPLSSKRLSEIAYKGARVSIVVSDASRPNIEKKVIPWVLKELYSAGVKAEDITIIVGGGAHRAATKEEMIEMFGKDVVERIRVLTHSSKNSPFADLGRTSDGYPVHVNKYFVDADIKIALGTVLPHPFAGYSGGGKAIAIGLGSDESISSTHIPKILDHPKTGLGMVEDNPFIKFTYEVARKAGLNFLINCVVNENEELVGIKCGELEQVHQSIINESARMVFEVPFSRPADVVIAAIGHPKDTNLFHACAEGVCVATGHATPNPCVKKGGSIIIVSPIYEGPYNYNFYNRLCEGKTPEEVLEITRTKGIALPGQHRAYAVASILAQGHEVIFANALMDFELIKKAHMKAVDTVEEALNYCYAKHGLNAEITVLRNSHRLVPVFESI